MSIEWMLYLAGLTDSFAMLFSLLSFSCGIGLIVLIFGYFQTDEESRDTELVKMLKLFMVFFIAFSLTACLLPSKKTIYLMIASNKMNEIPEKSLKVINKKLDEYLADDQRKNTDN